MSLFEEKTNVTSEDLESESAFDEIYDDEPLCVRHSTSYSIKKSNNSKLSARQTIDTVAVDRAIARALKSRPKTFEFRHKHLKYLPPSISHLSVCSNLREFDISSNELQSLPDEIAQITSIESINLGNNFFNEFPNILGSLPNLVKLLLFNNKLQNFSASLNLLRLANIRILNLNQNSIKTLPKTINELIHLEILTIEHNQLEQIPNEIGGCRRLNELHLGFNQLTKLPLEIGYLIELRKLVVHRNKLVELPESITNLKGALRHLDVSCNSLRIFPSKFHTLQLTRFHAEGNPFIDRSPIHSIQESEILSLKEACARRAMSELRHPTINFQPTLRERVQHFKRAKEILMQCTECQFCHNYFLNTWLECVEFIDVPRTFKGTSDMSPPALPVVPQRALLCSYECFNSPGHNYFGVAFG